MAPLRFHLIHAVVALSFWCAAASLPASSPAASPSSSLSSLGEKTTCRDLLSDPQVSESDLLLYCRSLFESSRCQRAAELLGDRPWDPTRVGYVCGRFAPKALPRPPTEAAEAAEAAETAAAGTAESHPHLPSPPRPLDRSLAQKSKCSSKLRRCTSLLSFFDNVEVPWDAFYSACLLVLDLPFCALLHAAQAAEGGPASRPIGEAAVGTVCGTVVGSVCGDGAGAATEVPTAAPATTVAADATATAAASRADASSEGDASTSAVLVSLALSTTEPPLTSILGSVVILPPGTETTATVSSDDSASAATTAVADASSDGSASAATTAAVAGSSEEEVVVAATTAAAAGSSEEEVVVAATTAAAAGISEEVELVAATTAAGVTDAEVGSASTEEATTTVQRSASAPSLVTLSVTVIPQ